MTSDNHALKHQVGGGHYKDCAIQPVEYNYANNLPFIEGCIVKYATRWRSKGGLEDLRKIKHFCDLLIDFETKARPSVQNEDPNLRAPVEPKRPYWFYTAPPHSEGGTCD